MASDAGHQALIQAFMSKGPQSKAETQRLIAELAEGSQLEAVLRKINDALQVLQLELRSAVNQKDGGVWFGMVNRAADKQAKLGTQYSHQQIQFFKAIVEHIALNSGGTGTIGNINVNNLVSRQAEAAEEEPSSSQRVPAKPMTVAEKEKTVEKLVHDKWLERSGCGEDGEQEAEEEEEQESGLKLGIRTYLEMRQYLKSIDGVPLCAVCEDPAIEARSCEGEDCDCRIHLYCESREFRRAKDPKCPTCSTAWPYVPPRRGGEAAATTQAERASQRSRAKRKRVKGEV